MKKTLQEEKDRIIEITKKLENVITEGRELGPLESNPFNKVEGGIRTGFHPGKIPYSEDLKDAIGEFMMECKESGIDHETIKNEIMKYVDEILSANDDEGPDANDIDSDGREYGEQYNKNMSQGFSELKEGNTFSGAANKAKEDGKDTFEFKGKTYNVSGTVKKEEPKEGATNMAIGFGKK